MATDTLVRVPTDDQAAIMALSLRDKGINVTQQFWMTPSELGWRILALVSPEADGPNGYNLHPKILAVLDGLQSDTRIFMVTRTMVFGEKEIEKELRQIRSGYTRVTEIGPYTDVEIALIPRSSDIHKSGIIDFIPETPPGDAPLLSTVVFSPLDGESGTRPFLRNQGEPELTVLFDAFRLRAGEQARVLDDLSHDRSFQKIVYDIGLETLYHLKLVWFS
jgi:hypothetical protein